MAALPRKLRFSRGRDVGESAAVSPPFFSGAGPAERPWGAGRKAWKHRHDFLPTPGDCRRRRKRSWTPRNRGRRRCSFRNGFRTNRSCGADITSLRSNPESCMKRQGATRRPRDLLWSGTIPSAGWTQESRGRGGIRWRPKSGGMHRKQKKQKGAPRRSPGTTTRRKRNYAATCGLRSRGTRCGTAALMGTTLTSPAWRAFMRRTSKGVRRRISVGE